MLLITVQFIFMQMEFNYLADLALVGLYQMLIDNFYTSRNPQYLQILTLMDT